MFADRIEGKWIDAFCEVMERCAVKKGDTAAILSETQSRALNVHLAELALLRLGARPFSPWDSPAKREWFGGGEGNGAFSRPRGRRWRSR